MKVSQYMSRPVLTIGPETEFHRAFDLMHSRRIHHLPVVDGNRVVGIVAALGGMILPALLYTAVVTAMPTITDELGGTLRRFGNSRNVDMTGLASPLFFFAEA